MVVVAVMVRRAGHCGGGVADGGGEGKGGSFPFRLIFHRDITPERRAVTRRSGDSHIYLNTLFGGLYNPRSFWHLPRNHIAT